MAKMPGHKAGCKCVGCNAATRRRGQAALEAHREGTTRKNPAAAAKPKPKPKPKPRRNPEPTPAPAPAARSNPTRTRTTTAARKPRKNPDAATATQAAARPAPCRCPHLPAPLSSGEYLVLVAGPGGKLQPVKSFGSLRAAEDHLKTITAPRAVVAQIKSTWGGA